MCRMFSFNNYLVVYPVLLLLLLRGGNVRNLDYLEQVWTSCNALCALVQSCWSIGLSKWYRNSFPCFLMDPPPPLFSTPSQLASSQVHPWELFLTFFILMFAVFVMHLQFAFIARLFLWSEPIVPSFNSTRHEYSQYSGTHVGDISRMPQSKKPLRKIYTHRWQCQFQDIPHLNQETASSVPSEVWGCRHLRASGQVIFSFLHLQETLHTFYVYILTYEKLMFPLLII